MGEATHHHAAPDGDNEKRDERDEIVGSRDREGMERFDEVEVLEREGRDRRDDADEYAAPYRES